MKCLPRTPGEHRATRESHVWCRPTVIPLLGLGTHQQARGKEWLLTWLQSVRFHWTGAGLCSHKAPHALEGPCLVQCCAVTTWKFLIVSERGALHFSLLWAYSLASGSCSGKRLQIHGQSRTRAGTGELGNPNLSYPFILQRRKQRLLGKEERGSLVRHQSKAPHFHTRLLRAGPGAERAARGC